MARDGIPHDRPGQLKQIESGLLPGEQIIAVYDVAGWGTGYIGLTDKRVIIQHKSFVGKRMAITSIPYSRISSVSMVGDKSIAGSFFSSGRIAVHVGQELYEIELRGEEKTHHIHNTIMYHITL